MTDVKTLMTDKTFENVGQPLFNYLEIPDHMFFFFSSRRRHTRCSRDWSSDVCSSDLVQAGDGSAVLANQGDLAALDHRLTVDLGLDDLSIGLVDEDFRNASFQQFFLGIVAQHAHQC